MNLTLLFVIHTLWSYKNELKYVLITFLVILSLPLFALIVVTNTGIQIVSDNLVTLNIQSHRILIHDPTGKAIKELTVLTKWPVHGVITLGFGESDLPYQPFHTGIDIASPNGKIGDPITPFMKGKVIYAGEISWGYGKHIIIDNGDNITSLYGHLSEIDVKQGDEVTPKDIIGKEGQTGWATGPHLHFEIRIYGIPVNPKSFVIGTP